MGIKEVREAKTRTRKPSRMQETSSLRAPRRWKPAKRALGRRIVSSSPRFARHPDPLRPRLRSAAMPSLRARCLHAISSREQHLFHFSAHPNPLRTNIHSIYFFYQFQVFPNHSSRKKQSKSLYSPATVDEIHPNPSSLRK